MMEFFPTDLPSSHLPVPRWVIPEMFQ
jgi:hypothetical protein